MCKLSDRDFLQSLRHELAVVGAGFKTGIEGLTHEASDKNLAHEICVDAISKLESLTVDLDERLKTDSNSRSLKNRPTANRKKA